MINLDTESQEDRILMDGYSINVYDLKFYEKCFQGLGKKI